MTSKEKKGLEQWLKFHAVEEHDAESLDKLWKATGTYREQYQPDAEAGFSKFKARLQRETEETPKVIRMSPFKRLLKVAAAVVLLAAGAYVFKAVFQPATPTETLTAEAGNVKNLQLSDGTTVTLNEESSLIFPEDFTKKTRQVALEGEAFFNVVKDASKPFIVKTELAEIQVIGTSFNVRAYTKEENVEVYVESGKVKVKILATGETVELAKGEKLVYEKKQNKIAATKDHSGNPAGWKNGVLFFKERTFRDIFSEIERQFGIEVKANDSQLLNCRYTLTIEKKQFREDLNSIKIACPVEFTEISENQYIVSGSCCE